MEHHKKKDRKHNDISWRKKKETFFLGGRNYVWVYSRRCNRMSENVKNLFHRIDLHINYHFDFSFNTELHKVRGYIVG